MRNGKMRTLTVATFVLLAVASVTAAWSADIGPIWPTYHFDNSRKGQNDKSTDISNPASLNLIWSFPRGVNSYIDEELTIVDDLNTTYFTPNPTWFQNLVSEESWEKHFLWTWAAARDDIDVTTKLPNYTKTKVIWRLPAKVGKGRFQIMVWVPSIYRDDIDGEGTVKHHNSTKAEYTVYDDSGANTFKLDQTDGGYWKPLTTRQFSFEGSGNYRVELSNVTDDSKAFVDTDHTVIVADALKFVPGTGQEIYASPTSANIPWTFEWTYTGPTGTGIPSSADTGIWDGGTTAVYVGTVENPLVNTADAPQSGAIYCVNSITPSIRAYDNTASGSDYKRNYALSQQLGTTMWRYPRSPEERMSGTKGGLGPNDLEGPIEGGIFSSITLARTGPGDNDLVAYATAEDRQTYALNAVTGELLWKGPGLTATEGTSITGWTTIGDWEAFGGRYHYINCVASNAAVTTSAEWKFEADDRQKAGEPKAGGWSYSIYAWIPAVNSAEGGPRAKDATYTITYNNGTIPDFAAKVRLDQSLLSNQGRWVQLGSSYFSVAGVKLTNTTATANPTTQCVVADAIMIVPDTIGPFGYCTPVVDVEQTVATGDIPSNVFVANASGRALSFKRDGAVSATNSTLAPMGVVNWIFPAVRTKTQVTGEADLDKPSMGSIGASPVYIKTKDLLVVASLDGSIHGISGAKAGAPSDNSAGGWVFSETSTVGEEPDAGFTSSPAYDERYDQLIVGSTGGKIYSLNAGGGTVNWSYPGSAGSLPLGAFRYSTPAIADDKEGMRRAWIASNDGHIYSFDIGSGSTERRLYVEFKPDGQQDGYHGKWYVEPSMMVSVQGSIAIDGIGSGKDPVMYVGDMGEKGILHWFSAKNGLSDWTFNAHPTDPNSTAQRYQGWQTEGQLFSSPNLTHLDLSSAGATQPVSYIYCGCGDGRIYAWSRAGGAWGGRWAGGEWPFEGEENDYDQSVTVTAPDTDVQFEMFTPAFYTQSETKAAIVQELKTDTITGTSVNVMDKANWGDDWIVSQEMKKPPASTFSGMTTQDQYDKALTKLAKKRRTAMDRTGRDAIYPDKTNRTDKAIYFEWGEKINLVLWNLPGLDYLYGTSDSSKKANIRFTFANTSPGASAGSVTVLGSTRLLKEYTVLNDVAKKGTDADGGDIEYYDALNYPGAGNEIKRCYALAQIEIKSTGSNPPSPGPGWVLTVEIRKKSNISASAPVTQIIIPLAKLMPKTLEPVINKGTDPNDSTVTYSGIQEQSLGINNPLAIAMHDLKIGWPATGMLGDRENAQAHFNGNAIYDTAGGYSEGIMPTLDLGRVAHGTSSPQLELGVMDRSATGLNFYPGSNPVKQMALDRFRINSDDLRFRGGDAAISGPKFPWELGLDSVDYPNIYKRYQRFLKQSDDGDPSRQATRLPPLVPNAGTSDSVYNLSHLLPDAVGLTVDVPRFQPANDPAHNMSAKGYSRSMQAYIDSNGDGHFDSGNAVRGRPTTYQEAYRRFRAALAVPADPRIEVEEQLIDLGQEAHGLGEAMPFVPYNPDPTVRQYFKRLTVKNAGNMNLANMKIGKDYSLFMLKDPSSLFTKPNWASMIGLPGDGIRSTLDRAGDFGLEPFASIDPKTKTDWGYTLTKAKVGDPDPTVLTVPDKRKWDSNYRYQPMPELYTRDTVKGVLQAAGWTPDQIDQMSGPLPMEVGLAVPVSQPVGTYQLPFVPVFSDEDGNGLFSVNANKVPTEPFAAPSFGLKVTVRETQMTGDKVTASLGQIDRGWLDINRALPEPALPRFGDSTPAAFRDYTTGNVYLFWSSNRVYEAGLLPTPALISQFAGAPWFIDRAVLGWDMVGNRWAPALVSPLVPTVPNRWWWTETSGSNPFVPAIQWPSALLGLNASKYSVMPWQYNGAATTLKSVRHTAPTIAENLDAAPGAEDKVTWLGWAGTADVIDDTHKISQEHRIFYTDVTNGNIGGGGGASIWSIEHNPSVDKRSPSFSVFNSGPDAPGDRMWAFWQGGDNGKWSIYYSLNTNAAGGFPTKVGNNDQWSDDQKLRTPDCLTSVSSPNAVHRTLWENMSTDPPNATKSKHIFDVIYAGIPKLNQTSDVVLSRYAAIGPGDGFKGMQPGSQALPMPRVFGEKLQRDAKYGFYTSEHLAWTRLAPKRIAAGGPAPVIPENWGAYDQASRDADLPYVRVVFPMAYTLASGTVLPAGTAISATDCSVGGADPKQLNLAGDAPSTDFRLQVDAATGVYKYIYPDGSVQKELLGDMLVDFSAGIVRFTKQLKELKDADGKVNAAGVYVDYTPLTWRLTTDPAADDSPKAFVERTLMNPGTNPGLAPKTNSMGAALPAPVDRLWVLWRKAATGLKSSTVFWKTYRIGVDLAKLGYPPIPMLADGKVDPAANLTISGALGPYEVDRTGTRIYFTEADERYRSLAKPSVPGYLTGSVTPAAVTPPAVVMDSGTWQPIVISYKYMDNGGLTTSVAARNAYDVFWLNELRDQSLFGFASDSTVNEGSVYGFADMGSPNPAGPPGAILPTGASKIWAFWTSTRSGTSDLCWATLSPNFTAR